MLVLGNMGFVRKLFLAAVIFAFVMSVITVLSLAGSFINLKAGAWEMIFGSWLGYSILGWLMISGIYTVVKRISKRRKEQMIRDEGR